MKNGNERKKLNVGKERKGKGKSKQEKVIKKHQRR